MGIGQGSLKTLFKDAKKLCWPDGFSFGHGGVLYLTDSALQECYDEICKADKECPTLLYLSVSSWF